MATDQVKDFLKTFLLTDDQLTEVFNRFGQDITNGLGKATNPKADIKCWITYVQDLPNGSEEGKYLALDLGGTNFRVLCVTLKGKGEVTMVSDVYPIPKDIMVGTGEKLFDHIAECLAKFVEKEKLGEEHLSLGFTFSFPCVQLSLTQAKLVIWTKGFQCSGVENEDVGRLLSEAIERLGGKKIDVVAILNDTTGTLMSCAHRNPDCRIGVIIGTGCNACYVERVENVELLAEEFKKKPKMIINCEWGAFGDSGTLDFIRTDYDRIIDEKSLNKGHQLFEKMIAGMYLGELVRLALRDAVEKGLAFEADKDALIDFLTNNENCIETNHISEVELDDPRDMTFTTTFVKDTLKATNATPEDLANFRLICEAVSRRAASFAALGLSSLTNRIDEPKVIIAVDGSVYRYHPKFDAYMRETMAKFINPKIKFDMMLSEDGSGRGAALVAAVAGGCECNCTC